MPALFKMYTVWTISTKRCPAHRKSKKVSRKWEGPILRARGADLEVEGEGGGLLQMCKHEQTRGVWGYALPRNFKFKSSEMALNASKPANSNIKL